VLFVERVFQGPGFTKGGAGDRERSTSTKGAGIHGGGDGLDERGFERFVERRAVNHSLKGIARLDGKLFDHWGFLKLRNEWLRELWVREHRVIEGGSGGSERAEENEGN
jgi:hypothetical protein